MTDPHDFDELASAHLDGATSPEEAARVAADPDLQARVEELREVREAVSGLPPVDATRRDAAIAAALAAFEDEATPAESVAPVTPLSPRRGLSPTAIRALSAAAVVAILALLVPLLANIDSDDESAKTFDSTGDAIAGANDSAGDGGAALAPESGGVTGGDAEEASRTVTLGTYDDLDALAAAVAAGDLDTQSSPTTLSTAAPSEFTYDCGPAAPDTVLAVAVVDGERVAVAVQTFPDGSRTMTVRRAATCEVLDQRQL